MENKPEIKTPQIKVWEQYHKEIEKLIDSGDIANFLQWYPIQRAVFVGSAKHILYKLNWINKNKNRDEVSFLLKENWIGNPPPLRTAEYTSGTRVNMLYHLMRFEESTSLFLRDFDFIFEFGGGYGCLAEMLFRAGFSGKYIIYDIPVMNRIQEYYLSEAGLEGKVKVTSDLEDLNNIVPESAFIATMSFSEIPIDSRVEIEKHLDNFDCLFFAYAGYFHGIDNYAYFKNLKFEFFKNNSFVDFYKFLIDFDLPVVRAEKYYEIMVKK